MDATKNLNAAMRYIEKSLFDVIDSNKMAKLAGCSEYQFRRMFSHLANMPLNEYIRKRKLSLAVDLLRSSELKIINIAGKCGYGSPDAFGKAFKTQYGMTPMRCRKSSDILKAFPPLFFQLSLIGGKKMDCHIIKREELLFEGCLVKSEGGNAWAKWEEMDSKEASDQRYAHHYQVDDYPNESRAHEIRFYPEDAEYAIFDIDQKIDMRPQFQGANDWLEENKDKYKQMEWDADGRIESAIFVINQYDHRGKYQKDKIMELWIPLVKLK